MGKKKKELIEYTMIVRRFRVRRILRADKAVAWDDVEEGDTVTFKFMIASLSDATVKTVGPNEMVVTYLAETDEDIPFPKKG